MRRWMGVLALGLAVWFLQALLMPKYVSEIPEGALIGEYYRETEDHDVLFIGDCEVYETCLCFLLFWYAYLCVA